MDAHMTDSSGNLFQWEDFEPDEMWGAEHDEDPWHDRPGAWRPIATVHCDRKVDLWFTRFEFDGELVRDCWWNESAAIPDWYRLAADGTPELAVPLFACLSHWKEPAASEGPDVDGGPGLAARVTFDEGMKETWPAEMRDRYDAYYRGVKEGLVEYELTLRGCTPLETVAAASREPTRVEM
jgi:hypothetical protein